MFNSSVLDQDLAWVLLTLFSIFWIGLGIFWGRKAKSLDGFMLAGRNVGLALGTATAMATWVTSNTMMWAPQNAMQLGIWGMLGYSTAAFGLILFAPLSKRIRQLMPSGYTSGDFIRLRYGKSVWYVFLVISMCYSLIWLITMAMGGGIALNALAGIEYKYGVIIILTVCVVYTLFGGLYAVIGTDFIQSLIILAGILIVGISIVWNFDFDNIYLDIKENQPALITILFPPAIMAFFNNLLFGLGEIFHSNVWWSRAFSMAEGVGKKAYTFAGLFWLPIPVAAGFIALSGGFLDIHVTRPDMIGPLITAQLLGKAGAIVIFIVIFSSLASSIDSLLASTSDLITRDIVKKILFKNINDEKLRKLGTFVIISLGVLALLLSLPNFKNLGEMLSLAGPLVGSTIWPIIAGLYWKKTNKTGVFLALVLGSITGLIAYENIAWYTSALLATSVSMLIVLLSTLIFPSDFKWEELNEPE